ncbi:hypothetical protein TKK_0016050 [Trichogramma kaykai]
MDQKKVHSSMNEVPTVNNIFNRLVDKYTVKYTYYIGDGDVKSYYAISACKPYGSTDKRKKLSDELLYGNAICQHSDNIDEMHKAIWATYFHCLSTDESP